MLIYILCQNNQTVEQVNICNLSIQYNKNYYCVCNGNIILGKYNKEQNATQVIRNIFLNDSNKFIMPQDK